MVIYRNNTNKGACLLSTPQEVEVPNSLIKNYIKDQDV